MGVGHLSIHANHFSFRSPLRGFDRNRFLLGHSPPIVILSETKDLSPAQPGLRSARQPMKCPNPPKDQSIWDCLWQSILISSHGSNL
jgi:hypothetical protein